MKEILICLYVSILILYYLSIYRISSTMQIFPDDNQHQPSNNVNNQRYNPSLLNHRDIFIVVIYTYKHFIYVKSFLLPSNEISLIFAMIIFNAICSPSFFYCLNSKLRQFYLRHSWENAPNYLRFLNPDHIMEINNKDNNIELGPLPQKRYHKKSQIQACPHNF